jgi:NAD(P)-dependent dehydrogenase (short-subunit alcohol dehydrogenase family)
MMTTTADGTGTAAAGALADRTAPVTGAASGIGAAVAKAFAAAGARLCLVDRAPGDALHSVREHCAQHGQDVDAVHADVSVEDGVTRMFAAATEQLGTVDVLVSNTPLGGGLPEQWTGPLPAGLPLKRFGQPKEVAPTAVLPAGDPGGNIYAGQRLGPNSRDVMV